MELSSPILYKSIKIDKMEVIKTDIEDVLIIEPRLFRDARGYFFESFSEREFKEKA
jgi:dTDP-4-dehydrorhamnose 3,5-epimerase-like enzyme